MTFLQSLSPNDVFLFGAVVGLVVGAILMACVNYGR